MQEEGRTLRILIGELDSALRASIAFSLSQAGHEVQEVSEEASVLSFLKQGSIDIALLDLHIAKPDAIELCRTIRRSFDRLNANGIRKGKREQSLSSACVGRKLRPLSPPSPSSLPSPSLNLSVTTAP
jgi:CheY-like chemotaxis protein